MCEDIHLRLPLHSAPFVLSHFLRRAQFCIDEVQAEALMCVDEN